MSQIQRKVKEITILRGYKAVSYKGGHCPACTILKLRSVRKGFKGVTRVLMKGYMEEFKGNWTLTAHLAVSAILNEAFAEQKHNSNFITLEKFGKVSSTSVKSCKCNSHFALGKTT